MRSLSLLVTFTLFLVSCGNNGNSSKEIPKVTTTKPTATNQASIESNLELDPGISGINQVLVRLNQINQDLKSDIFFEVYDFLNSCSIGVPKGSEHEVEVIKSQNSSCLILVLTEEDAKSSSIAKTFIEDNLIAQYDYNNNRITLRLLDNVSVDYTTMVLVHEALHAITGVGCEIGDFQCKAQNEFNAYLGEFIIFDYLAERNNSRYQEILYAGAQKMSIDYEKSGLVQLPDYSKSKQIRAFFNSKSEYEDKLLFSIFWLRQYWEMYLILRGNYENAQISFVAFLETMYSKEIL